MFCLVEPHYLRPLIPYRMFCQRTTDIFRPSRIIVLIFCLRERDDCHWGEGY